MSIRVPAILTKTMVDSTPKTKVDQGNYPRVDPTWGPHQLGTLEHPTRSPSGTHYLGHLKGPRWLEGVNSLIKFLQNT
jgi:hypothetical protein